MGHGFYHLFAAAWLFMAFASEILLWEGSVLLRRLISKQIVARPDSYYSTKR